MMHGDVPLQRFCRQCSRTFVRRISPGCIQALPPASSCIIHHIRIFSGPTHSIAQPYTQG